MQPVKNWAAQELALRVAEIAISTLEKNGIRALPVKGVLLARQVYDPALRPISDVDLLVAPGEFQRSIRCARASGWELVWDTKALGSVNFVIDEVAVDVKSSLGPPGISALGVAEVLERAALSEQPLGFPHWQIDRHDHALLLAIDAFKDKLGHGKPWAREDLVRIAAGEGFSESALVDRATAAKLRTMLTIVADWILAAGPSSRWTKVREHLGSVSLRSGYVARYARSLQTAVPSRWEQWYLSALTRAVSDSRRQRGLALALGAAGTARYLVRHGGLRVNAWQARRRPHPR